MAKKKNKGFSLIEVVIAVAVLGLLITPILTQIVQTSNTSRRAKERQAAVENAEYIMNFIQRTDKSELDKASSDGLDDVNILSKSTHSVECKLIDKNGDDIKFVKYNATVYILDDVKLGPKSNEYTRKVVLDDLNNCILAEGYEILYDKSQFSGNIDKYTVTNEGSIVKYFEATPDLVAEIVVVPRAEEFRTDATYKYVNPNKVSLGFIQDLDSTKVAIIQGIASNFDAQVSSEFFSQKMNTLKLNDEDEWNNQIGRTDDTVFANDETAVRLLYVSIKAVKDADVIKYYEVKCDVCYYDNYTIVGYKGKAKLKYNVFAKKFYTTKSPDIYLIYEPFVSDAKNSYYSYNDYIEIYNDADTADSKLYLIKPSQNQFSGNSMFDGYEKNYVTINDNKLKPVNINMTAVYAGDETVSKKLIHTYTNIKFFTGYGWEQFSFDNTIRTDGPTAGYEDIKADELAELRKMPLPDDNYYTMPYCYAGYDHLHQLEDDTNMADRLYTITVVLKPVSGDMDDVRYISGKGVD